MKAENATGKGTIIGYDRRFLSKETVKSRCEVFAAEGIPVHFVCRSVPTPLIMNYVMKYSLPFPVSRISDLDGCKLFFENGGWVIIRFSGTASLLRVFCEMPTKKDAVTVCELIREYYDI